MKHHYRVGELVLLKDHTRKKRKGGKLDARWLGPFKICECLPRGVYTLSGNAGQIRRAAGAQLKMYRKPNSQQASNQPQSPNPSMSTYTQSPSSDIFNHTLSPSRSIPEDCMSPSSYMSEHTQSQSTSVSEDYKWPSSDIFNHTQSSSRNISEDCKNPGLDTFNPTQSPRINVSEDCKSPSSPDKESIPYLLPLPHLIESISYFLACIFNSVVCLFWCRATQVHHGTSPHR